MRFAKLSPSTLVILGALPLGWLSLTACNSFTGVDDIYLTDDMGDDDASSSNAGATATSGGSTGQGGATGANASTGVGAGSGASTTASASNGAAGTTVASSSAATGSGGGPCQYPAGPYGVGQGQTVPPNLSWQGYAPGASSPSTVSIQDFFDCDGAKGIHAVLFDTSQFG